jgi:hypothetical protein
MADTIRMEIKLVDSMEPPTIILGYEIGHADIDDGRRLEIIGSGKLLRFTVVNRETNKRIKQYDLDLTKIASKVVHR